MSGWRLEHTYTELPRVFHSDAVPTPVRDPRLVVFNRPLAVELGLDPAMDLDHDAAALFAGNLLPDGAKPFAQAYAGHQFGHFTGLGDGRAIMLGEQVTTSGERFDVQLKGAGPTVYSRRGDGRAALGPMLREYIVSEAMHALGIPTTRSLAVASTGEPVFRETVLPGAVLTRVAASHIRVGTMQWAAAHQDRAAVRALADYTIARHYPHIADTPDRYVALFEAILARQASLIAAWQLVGFIHGVMNTDNMALSGETIDYGPCAFMDAFDPGTVFSSIDHAGRYAYGQQPAIVQWNLARLAEAMLSLFDPDRDKAVEIATEALERFPAIFHDHWMDRLRSKLGLFAAEEGDEALADDLFVWMQRSSADFTNTFRRIMADSEPEKAIAGDDGYVAWFRRLEARRQRQPQSVTDARALMARHNPAVIPRNHLVEAALGAATERGDLSAMHRLLAVLEAPYDHARDLSGFDQPGPAQSAYRTFCGT